MRQGTGPILALVIMLSGERALAQSVADGVWRGRTSQGQEIEIAVSKGGVASIKLAVVLTLDALCPVTPGNMMGANHRLGNAKWKYRKPMPITDGHFAVAARGPEIEGVVSGTFLAETAHGEIALRAAAGSHCTGRDELTWSAAKKRSGK